MRSTIVLAVVAFSCSRCGEAREPSVDDYAVWGSVLDQASVSRPTYVWHTTEASSQYDRRVAELFKRELPEEAYVIAAAQAASNDDQGSIRAGKFPNPTTVRTLDERLLLITAGRRVNSTWIMSPRAFGKANEIVRFSWPYYSPDGNHAYFFSCSCLVFKRGCVMFNRVEKRNGRWMATNSSTRYLTKWADGFVDDRADL